MDKEILEKEKKAIWLDSFGGITLKQKFALLECFGDPQTLFDRLIPDAEYVKAVVGENIYKKMLTFRDDAYIERVIEQYKQLGVGFVSRYNDKYSNLLRQIEKPPLVLYYKGDISLLNTFCISMIGTRHCTHYGADCARKFAKELAENDITIVSGLATGIDTCAHEGALAGGKTISVFAGGVDQIYPASNAQLADKIEKQGLIISEYPPKTPIVSYNFPVRNRIIAGLSRGVLIVEAPLKSGTMHTKEYALSEHRDVFCIPGNITSIASQGTNKLIHSQEAECVLCPADILNYYYITPKVKADKVRQQQQQHDGLIGKILDILSIEMTDFETLKLKTQEDTKLLTQTLTKMEIMGAIKKLPGNKYELKS